MAEFTDQDRELLDKLRKALERAAKTSSARTPWQEHVSRDESVDANRAALAAKIVEGFSGSWAAQYEYGFGSLNRAAFATGDRPFTEVDPLGPPAPIRAKTNKLGRRGPPEINFVPYNWRTNTFGSKGPAVVGHPISFEVVGPTLKSPFTDWTWRVDQGAGANGGDLLTPDVRPDGIASLFTTSLTTMYGPQVVPSWTLGDANEPNGGLYLVVTDDGTNPGSLYTGGGQVAMSALPNFLDTARYEIFRISAITVDSIEVHPNKSLSNFFDLPLSGTRWIRAIMIVRPYVTRLAAIPQTGAEPDGGPPTGREQTFAIVSPERAATSDLFPPFAGTGPGSGDGSWFGGGFTEARAPGSGIAPGDVDVYGGGVRLPIPVPVMEGRGNVETGLAVLPSVPTGTWKIYTPNAPFLIPEFSAEYPIAKLFATWKDDALPDFTMGSVENALGWFDVIAVQGPNGPDATVFARVPEADPQTGLIYYGPGPYIQNVTLTTEVGFELYQPVSELWRGPFSLDKVEATRIRNLIDPRWVERFTKQISDPTLPTPFHLPPPPRGSGAGRPDRAIFPTEIMGRGFPDAANPGNLMDLGFRVVLYPAKEVADLAVPDFDMPIVSREVLIDGSETDEDQYVEVDYSAGIVRLSVPPPASSGGVPSAPSDIVPNGIVGLTTNNERGEVVLFAACVPYSMEDSQVGTGARITSHASTEGTDYDVSSAEVRAQIDLDNTAFVPGAPYVGVSPLTGANDLVLDRIWNGPETGVVTVTQGSDDSPAFGRWGYMKRKLVTVPAIPFSRQVTALGELSCGTSALDPTPLSGEPRSVIMRREVVFSPSSPTVPSFADTYVGDTTFGSSIRADVLRFQDCRTIYDVDGSVTIVPRSPGFAWHQAGEWGPAGDEDPISLDDLLTTTGVLGGVLYQEDQGAGFIPNAPSQGFTRSDYVHGQYWRLPSGNTMNWYRGAITRNSRIVASHNFRLVVKFKFLLDLGNVGFYIGLIGPSGTATVQDAVIDPAPTNRDFLGLRIFGPNNPATPFTFIGQEVPQPPGLTRLRSTVGLRDTPLFFVMESEQYFDSPDYTVRVPAFVKMGLYDENFNELGRARYYNQLEVPDAEMEFCIANLNPGPVVGANQLDLYYVKIINRTDLPFPQIP